jgi:hypothetical protein
VEIRPVGINCIDEEVREVLRKECDRGELFTLMVLSRRRNESLDKLSIQTFEPVIPGARAIARFSGRKLMGYKIWALCVANQPT